MSDLELQDYCVERSGFSIVRNVSLSVPAGQITVLLGPNGAGKTTLLEGISGLIPAHGGTITLGGQSIARASRVRRAGSGLGHVEQGRSVFAELTVVENMRVSARDRAAVDEALLMFPELEPRRDVLAGSLSGGEQQMLVIARALAARPTTILIDEMSLGLAPVIVQRLMPVVRRLADDGMGVLLVEQFAALALRVGDHALVLNRGEVVLEGAATNLLDDAVNLRRAYLGSGSDAVTTTAGA